jgi:hypothetical protein
MKPTVHPTLFLKEVPELFFGGEVDVTPTVVVTKGVVGKERWGEPVVFRFERARLTGKGRVETKDCLLSPFDNDRSLDPEVFVHGGISCYATSACREYFRRQLWI